MSEALFYILLGFAGTAVFCYFYDKKQYNNGICPKCGRKLVPYKFSKYTFMCIMSSCKYEIQLMGWFRLIESIRKGIKKWMNNQSNRPPTNFA